MSNSKLSTKNVATPSTSGGGGFVKSLIEPGKHEIKINSIYLRPESNPEYGDRLIMLVETKPIEISSFKGAAVDKNDPSKGTYAGQIGYLSYSKYSFRDWVTKNNNQIFRVDEIMGALKELCSRLSILEWWDSKDNVFETVEDLVKSMDAEKPFKDIWFHACIGGREYLSKDKKYINYELSLVSDDRNAGKGYSLNEKLVRDFFESEMVLKTTEKPIGSNQSKIDFVENNTSDNESLKINGAQSNEKDLFAETKNPAKIEARTKQEADFLNDGPNDGPKDVSKTSESKTEDDKKYPWDL